MPLRCAASNQPVKNKNILKTKICKTIRAFWYGSEYVKDQIVKYKI